MQEVREGLETLNLSQNYISHWTWLHGIREYYQNFMDACLEKHPESTFLNVTKPTQFKWRYTQAKKQDNAVIQIPENFIEYDKENQSLTLENDKCFPVKCMLMGCSEKGPEALGQFGQGMKISMIVILKEGLTMKIQSGDIVYYPTLKIWDHKQLFSNKYNKNVLYIQYEPQQKIEKTRVVISNFSSRKFQELKYLSLSLIDPLKFERITCGQSTLILTEDLKLKGKVFKKGVLLELRNPKEGQQFTDFSYDLKNIDVGRDRDCVNNVWDLYQLQSKLLYDVTMKNFDVKYMQDNPKFRQQTLPRILNIVYKYMETTNMQTYYFHTHSKNSKPLCDIFYKKFMIKNDKDYETQELYPINASATQSDITKALTTHGLPPEFYPYKIVNWQLYHTLVYSQYYQTIATKIDKMIKSLPQSLPNDNQSQILNEIKNKIATLLPEINGYTFKIKDFQHVVCFKQNNVFFVAKNQLNNQDKVMRTLMKILLI